MPERPVNGNHALRCGMVLGLLAKHGIDAEPVMLGGDYSDTIALPEQTLANGVTLHITLVVPPAPEDDVPAPDA